MIDIKNLRVSYGKNQVLKDISLNIKKGRITAIIGPNASGKTTLLNCLAGLTKYEGEVCVDGKDIKSMNVRQRAMRVSVLHQQLPASGMRVEHLVQMGRNPYVGIGRALTESDIQITQEAIKKTGIENIRHKTLDEISGGERQKAFLAAVLCQDTPVVLFDEPTTYMDKKNEKEFLCLVTQLCKEEKKTLVTVMHEVSNAVNIADDIIVLDEGKVIFCATSEECVKSAVIEKVFGVEKICRNGKTVYY